MRRSCSAAPPPPRLEPDHHAARTRASREHQLPGQVHRRASRPRPQRVATRAEQPTHGHLPAHPLVRRAEVASHPSPVCDQPSAAGQRRPRDRADNRPQPPLAHGNAEQPTRREVVLADRPTRRPRWPALPHTQPLLASTSQSNLTARHFDEALPHSRNPDPSDSPVNPTPKPLRTGRRFNATHESPVLKPLDLPMNGHFPGVPIAAIKRASLVPVTSPRVLAAWAG
jgi:hypothetical protein